MNFKTKCSFLNTTINNCCDLKLFSTPSGVYKLRKGAFDSGDVYCDMNTSDGGWLVIQRNKRDSEVNFDRNWIDYEEGFGDLRTEFWYGLKQLHCLTEQGHWEMRVDYQTTSGWTFIHYHNFSVGSASEGYPLSVGGYSEKAGDFFLGGDQPSGNMKFSTKDKDNDKWSGNCAVYYKRGWWYRACHDININKQPPEYDHSKPVLAAEMKIRPRNCIASY